VETIFGMIPREILGVILFLTGAQLALGSCDFSKEKDERFVTRVDHADIEKVSPQRYRKRGPD
jgi:hypothetical protein